MRVLMIVYNRVGKGTYWRALQLARVLAGHKHQVTIMATSQSQRWGYKMYPDEPGVTIVETPNVLGGPLSAGWDPLNLLARLVWRPVVESGTSDGINNAPPFDIVHAFECRPTVIFPALAWRRRDGTTLVMDWCDWFGREGAVAERKNPLMRALLRPAETFFEEHFRTWADGTTVICSLLRRFAADLGVPKERILDLPNGSDTQRLQTIPLANARAELKLDQEVPILGYIGAAFEGDGQLMAHAFNMVRQEVPTAKLLLAGYCNVAVEEWVDEPQSVIRTGSISNREVNLYLAASNVCWLPLCDSGANRGRFPLKVHDYIAAGRPVVGTDVGDLGNFIRAGGFGLAVADEPQALADAVVELLGDLNKQDVLGRTARAYAEAEATWQEAGDQLLAFYEALLKGN